MKNLITFRILFHFLRLSNAPNTRIGNSWADVHLSAFCSLLAVVSGENSLLNYESKSQLFVLLYFCSTDNLQFVKMNALYRS